MVYGIGWQTRGKCWFVSTRLYVPLELDVCDTSTECDAASETEVNDVVSTILINYATSSLLPIVIPKP